MGLLSVFLWTMIAVKGVKCGIKGLDVEIGSGGLSVVCVWVLPRSAFEERASTTKRMRDCHISIVPML